MINKFNPIDINFLEKYVIVVLTEILKVSSKSSKTNIVKKINELSICLDFIDDDFIKKHRSSYEYYCGNLDGLKELSDKIAVKVKITENNLTIEEIKVRIYRLSMLILMPPDIMKKYILIFKESLCGFTKIYIENMYNELRKNNISDEYVKELDVLMCPYCNINDISISDENYKFQSKYQLDHFFDKSTYPLLALSIYKLIPVCQKCNHIKLKKSMNTNPYLAECDDLEFSYNNYESSDKIVLIHKNDKIKEDIVDLQLTQRYNTQYSLIKKETEDLFDMCIKYSESYEKLNNIENKELYKEFKYWQKSALKDGLIKGDAIKNNRLAKVKNSIVKVGLGLDKYEELMKY